MLIFQNFRVVWFFALLMYFGLHHSFGQKTQISGIVTDQETGEFLISAHIYNQKTFEGCISNNYGFYFLKTTRDDSIELICSFVGYQSKTVMLAAGKDTILNFELERSTQLEEIEVIASRSDRRFVTSPMSTNRIRARDIELMPSLFGEPNLLKSIQMLPGVQSGNDGDSQIYVRGGSPDQNLILLDEVPLYYVSHYGGVFSIFNADAINDVVLIKGGFPAKYGGRLSSVLNVYMREGDRKKYHAKLNLGLLSSGILLEGPIVKEKSSFLFSARKSMLDLYTSLLGGIGNGIRNGFGFYDTNLKINYKLSDRDHIYLSCYQGDDKIFNSVKESEEIPYNAQTDIKWGNTAIATRWNHLFSRNLFMNTTAIFSKYKLASSNNIQYPGSFSYNSQYQSFVEDWSVKSDLEWKANNHNQIEFGVSGTRHLFSPGAFSFLSTDNSVSQSDSSLGSEQIKTFEVNAYLANDFIWRRFSGNFGVHYTRYGIYNKTYHSFEPRVSLNYLVIPNGSVKTSYTEMKQFLHLLTNSGLGLPTDLWVPATADIPPQKSRQIALGWAQHVKAYDLELSLEAYYKSMSDLIEYQEGVSMFSGKDWQNSVETNGVGKACGVEFLAQKQSGIVSGWFAYTWSRNIRQFDAINNGQEYFYRYDRPHELNFFVKYKIRKHIDLSASWFYKSGSPITLPVGRYQLESQYPGSAGFQDPVSIHIYPGKNQYRMRAYHRLDASVSIHRDSRKYQHSWSIGVINLYNRMNPSYYKIDAKKDGSLKLVQVTEFPFLPSVTYSVRFL